MLELTGLGSVMRGIGVLYWLAALAFLIGAVMSPRTRAGKAIAVAITLAAFAYLPGSDYVEQQKRAAFEREAWAYFKNKCATEAGEKIYKTFSGVKSVLVVKPLPPATEKDLYDQFWYGDPYSASAHSNRGNAAADTLLGPSPISTLSTSGFDFVEIKNIDAGQVQFKVLKRDQDDARKTLESTIEQPASRFGLAWEDISRPEDRQYWVAGSKFSILDLATNGVVAERIGFYIESGFGSPGGQRRPWLTSRGPNTTCPSIQNGTFEDRIFVLRVLRSGQGLKDGK